MRLPKNITVKNIGKLLYMYRKGNCISQVELSEELGVDRHTLSRWEKGINYPSETVLKLIRMKGII